MEEVRKGARGNIIIAFAYKILKKVNKIFLKYLYYGA